MKEIDFLPEWYKRARRRRLRYRMQYAVILCAFAGMVGWSFFAAKSVSNAQALMQQQKLSPAQTQALEECGQIQKKLSELGKQADVLKKLDSKVAIADVLAELSFLVDSKIVMTQIDIQAEGFEENGQAAAGGAGLVRISRNGSGLQALPDGDVRFKVVLHGMACDAGDAARLICKLEESPYFCQVIPGFSRTSKIKDRQMSEFEIGCCIANYKEAKRQHNGM
jgi:hypothetical protein